MHVSRQDVAASRNEAGGSVPPVSNYREAYLADLDPEERERLLQDQDQDQEEFQDPYQDEDHHRREEEAIFEATVEA